MITPSPKPDQAHDESDHQQSNGYTECDPEIVDCLKCKAEGTQAEADYNAVHLPDLSTARTTYDTARTAYRDARHAVALDVQDMRHQAKHLIERIKCLIKQEHVVRCLDEAYDKVKDQLEKCGYATGCCLDDDCEFDVDISCVAADEVDDVLTTWIADYQRRADAAKACFDDLVLEPGRLTTRVGDLKIEVAAITTDLGGDPATTDLKDLYARALVARRHVHEVWLGFEDTSDFVDCLCRALMVWSRGCSAIAVLTGEQAVRRCHETARESRCAYLRDHTAQEILAVYDKICSHLHRCHETDEKAKESAE